MKFMGSYAKALAAAFALLAGSATPAVAATTQSGETATSYVAAFAPVLGIYGVLHSGEMLLSVHDGTIEGTYTGTSVAPDPLDDRIVPVTGSISPDDGHVQLFIGGALSLQGTMAEDGTITGTATYRGRLYAFEARPRTTR
jgi:hypothetical protein